MTILYIMYNIKIIITIRYNIGKILNNLYAHTKTNKYTTYFKYTYTTYIGYLVVIWVHRYVVTPR